MTTTGTTGQEHTARQVLQQAGTTLAQQVGIRMADRPAPLWQLLVLTNLVSARISADIAVAAARELNAAGATTPAGTRELTWQQRVDALGRGHYVRYDESTASRLDECARIVEDTHHGDLRRMARAAEENRGRLEKELQVFPGIGPTGASIFCREAQAVWPWLRPYTDRLARKGAERVGLATGQAELGRLVDGDDMAAFTAGLVQIARDRELADQIGLPT